MDGEDPGIAMNFHGNDNNYGPSTNDADWGINEEDYHATSETFHTEERGVGNENDAQDGGSGGGGGESTASPLHDVVVEGYTPLNFNMNEFLMMQDGSDDASDDGGNFAIIHEEIDGELFSSGHYHLIGAATRRVNGVKDGMVGHAISHYHDDNDEDSSNTDMSNIGIEHLDYNLEGINSMQSLEVPGNFHLLAESALRGLEFEHSSTLEMSNMDRDEKSNEKFAHQSTACSPSGHEFCDGGEIQTADDLSSDTSDSLIKSAMQPSTSAEATEMLPAKESNSLTAKQMNVNAIQKAMQSIRLKSPELANTLDAGVLSSISTTAAYFATDAALASIINFSSRVVEQSQKKQFQSHPIIPAVPLAAFRRVTPKAQAASANLTRSATLSEAVFRLWPLICFRRKSRVTGIGILSQQEPNTSSKTLTIQIVGADGVECSSEASVRKSVGPFVRWLNAAIYSGMLQEYYGKGIAALHQFTDIDALLIEFVGPNLPSDMIGNVIDLLTPSITPTGLTSAKAIFHQREYHEGPSFADCTDTPLADLAIAFNAGIWGYDSWKPTIESMINGNNIEIPACDRESKIGNTIFVITAYTLEESEDDASVIVDLVETITRSRSTKLQENAKAIARQLWAPEPNPFSSRIERYTASAPPGRKYFENGAWQAWLLGV